MTTVWSPYCRAKQLWGITVLAGSFPLHLNSVTTDVATTTKTSGTQPLDEGMFREETRVRWGKNLQNQSSSQTLSCTLDEIRLGLFKQRVIAVFAAQKY